MIFVVAAQAPAHHGGLVERLPPLRAGASAFG
jgi:hypothetical protein